MGSCLAFAGVEMELDHIVATQREEAQCTFPGLKHLNE